jgi:hypothetical protein
MSMVVEVGEVESRDCLGEPRPRGKDLETLMPQESREKEHRTGSQSVSQWAQKNIGDIHKGKRKTYTMRPKRQRTRLKRRSIRFCTTKEDENSTTYQESNDSSSKTSSDDGNDENDTGGGTGLLATQGGAHE